MMKLENVSTFRLLEFYPNERIHKLLIRNNVLTYQELKNLIEKNPELLDSMIYDDLVKVENDVLKFNKKGVEPVIYDMVTTPEDIFGITDTSVYGDELLLYSPLKEFAGCAYGHLDCLTIAEIKHLLSHSDSYGNNSLSRRIPNIGDKKTAHVLETINMYNEQVIRQSMETEERDINLFYLNQEAKKEIVTDNFKDIVLYLLGNAKELIWGNLSDQQKKFLVATTIENTKKARIGRENLINVIANYTTLTELEKGIIKTKTLNRFIKK